MVLGVTDATLTECSTFGWGDGLNHRFGRARASYGTIAALAAVGLALNQVGIHPIQALFLASLICSLLTPPLLLITNNRQIMGKRRGR